jgi:hypothetical protein
MNQQLANRILVLLHNREILVFDDLLFKLVAKHIFNAHVDLIDVSRDYRPV